MNKVSMKNNGKKKDNDMKTMNSLRYNRVNPLDYTNKSNCIECGRRIPDSRYHGMCQDCYFEKNDVTMGRRR